MHPRTSRSAAAFDPAAFASFRFVARDMDEHGRITLTYALDDEITFTERFVLPLNGRLAGADRQRIEGLLSLLHWVAGVSYFKTAAPPIVYCEAGAPPPATARLLEALYSEGLGEFAYRSHLPALPAPKFPVGPPREPSQLDASPARALLPIGGGKDSIVALEAARRQSDVTLFSVGSALPIMRTAEVAGLPHLICQRVLDPGLSHLNRTGAMNGHVPVTAIVSCVALLAAALHGCGFVVMANERSASSGNVQWQGVEINHQFSKSLPVERLLREAVAESVQGLSLFSILRHASELAITRAFARMPQYHSAFTSCNTMFRLDLKTRSSSWCCDCPKCRFVFLAMAAFAEPAQLQGVFGRDMLDDDDQFAGFALLVGSGGIKPFECVGEQSESLAAMRLIAARPEWSQHRVVRRLLAEVLPHFSASEGLPEQALAVSDTHFIPEPYLADISALLGS